MAILSLLWEFLCSTKKESLYIEIGARFSMPYISSIRYKVSVAAIVKVKQRSDCALKTLKNSPSDELCYGCYETLSLCKDSLPRYGDFHYKNKTILKPSYIYNGNSFTGKTTFLYWDGPLYCEICRWGLSKCHTTEKFFVVWNIW